MKLIALEKIMKLFEKNNLKINLKIQDYFAFFSDVVPVATNNLDSISQDFLGAPLARKDGESDRILSNLCQQKEVCDNENKINHPSHYTQGGIECIDYLQAKLTPEEFKGFLKGNVLKYLSRSNLKGEEISDYQKSLWYLNKLIEQA